MRSKGNNFDTFYDNGFIGIGWNDITFADIRDRTDIEVKAKIAQAEGIADETSYDRAKVTGIYNKIVRFTELNQGDLIIIPSESSAILAFGVISGPRATENQTPINNCNYVKRRRVQWITKELISDLDPIFYKVVKSRHAISDVKPYENYIDNVTDTLYRKDGSTHFVFDVETQEPINMNDLRRFMEIIESLSTEINREFNLNENPRELLIKLNLQSPGKLEIRRAIGMSLIVLCLALSSCSNGHIRPTNVQIVDTFVNAHAGQLIEADSLLDRLRINKEKLNIR